MVVYDPAKTGEAEPRMAEPVRAVAAMCVKSVMWLISLKKICAVKFKLPSLKLAFDQQIKTNALDHIGLLVCGLNLEELNGLV